MSLRSLALAAAIVAVPSLASAADVIEPEVVADPVVEAAFSPFFVDIKGGFGTILPKPDVTVSGAFFGSPALNARFEDDWAATGSVEAGAFLTERFRLSGQFVYTYVEQDRLDFDAAAAAVLGQRSAPLNGSTDLYQGFAKAAYEVSLADIGFTAPLFARSSVFGTGGIGFSHFRPDFTTTLGAVGTARGNDSDTVLSGLVGFGSIYAFNDRVQLVSETNFIFGEDANLSVNDTLGAGINVPYNVESNHLTSHIGLRFRF